MLYGKSAGSFGREASRSRVWWRSMTPDEYYIYSRLLIGFYASSPGSRSPDASAALGVGEPLAAKMTFDLWREGTIGHGDEEPGEIVPT